VSSMPRRPNLSGSHIVQGVGSLFQVRDLVTLLLDHGIRCAAVRSVEEVAFDPELDEREMLKDNEYPTLDVSRSRRHRSSFQQPTGRGRPLRELLLTRGIS